MKPSFHVRPLNGPFEDPGIYVRIIREGRALLFDLGFTAGFSAGDILKISDIFVSHAHVDHFIGFDNILRISLKKENPLRLYGPEGFIDRVECKLKGYTWNLSGGYPLVIEVSEIEGEHVKKAVFSAAGHFRREDRGISPFEGVLVREPLFSVSAAVLDHRIPCLAFSMQEDYHINIDKARLGSMGIPVGPWIGKFKKDIRSGMRGALYDTGGGSYGFDELIPVADMTEGQKISYVVDVLGSEENRERIKELVKDSSVLYIEAYFLDEDRDRAADRYHLTAGEAGRIARDAGVKRLEVLHFSPRYKDRPGVLLKEAEAEFKKRPAGKKV